jgi:multiple sugar transport system substrate-binding protein
MAHHEQHDGSLPSGRRRFLRAIVGASASALVLSACGGGTTQSQQGNASGTEPGATTGSAAENSQAQPPGQSSSGPQTVRALMWSNGPVIDANFKKRAETFNAANQGKITIDLQLLPYDQYWSKIDLAYASKKPYDMYFWDVQAYGHYKAGLLADLQPFVDSAPELTDANQYPVKLYDNWRFDGAHLYALPENFQTMALYYNRDIFDQAGIQPPDDTWTWQKVRDVAKQLTKTEGDQTTQWGMSMGAMGVWWGAQMLAWGMGSSFVDKEVEPTKFQVSSAQNVAALKFLQDLIWTDKVAPNAEQASAVAQDSNIFLTGKIAMVPDGSWLISAFQQAGFKWDMAPVPKWNDTRVPPFWFGGWVIPKASSVPDSAFAFARWSATDYQKTMASEHDWIPIRKDARDSAEMKQGMPPGIQSVLNAINDARLGDIYHANGQKIIAEVLGPTLDQLWNNKITAEEAARQIDEKANPLLQKA